MGKREHVVYHDIKRPLYLQLKDILVEKIENGQLEPGDTLPGERVLAEQYDISRVTVRKSIGNMVEEGYLIRSHGKETMVANRKINHHLGLLVGIAEEIYATKSCVKVKGIHKEYMNPSLSIKEKLNLLDQDEVFGFYRVVSADEKPLVINYSYVPKEIGKLLADLDFDTAKVFSHLEHCGYDLSYANQEISAGLCRAEEAKYLDIKEGAPVLVIKRTSYLDNGVPLLYEKSVYRGDTYQYSIKLFRKL